MNQQIIKQWEERKHLLEGYFSTTVQSEYDSYRLIVKKILELVITKADSDCSWDFSKMTVIDDGDYQGTEIFIIPSTTYQPSVEDYLMTDTYYGSCSGCDTLLGICDYDDELPSESQVKEYMTLALHLVQKMKRLSE